MCANSTYDSRSRRPIPRFRFPRNPKRLDMEDAKVALDIIIRPSLQLWKQALGRNAFTALKRLQKTVDAPSTSHIPQKVILTRWL